MGLGAYLLLAAALFAIGLFGVVTRRNTIGILLGIELMLNAVNINLVAFARFQGSVAGMVFTVFTISITVAEVALGLALVILIFRVRGTVADADSTLMLILVTGVSFLVQVYSLGYLADESPGSLGRYYAYQSLFAFSMMGLVLAPNFVQLFICWELVGLCSYLLIGYWYQRPEAARAAVKAFWVTKAGAVGLLIGIVLLGRPAGTFDLGRILRRVDRHALPLAGLGVITFCIYLGAAGKSAQFPLHVWL